MSRLCVYSEGGEGTTNGPFAAGPDYIAKLLWNDCEGELRDETIDRDSGVEQDGGSKRGSQGWLRDGCESAASSSPATAPRCFILFFLRHSSESATSLAWCLSELSLGGAKCVGTGLSGLVFCW